LAAPRLLDAALFGRLAEQAAASPRRRQHHNLHEMAEPCHRMAVGLQPGSYVAPHRHLSADKAESLLVLRGRLGLLCFDDQGAVTGRHELHAGGECVGVDLPPGLFHALVVLEADSVLFECKAGPYRPLGEGEHAAWAPREGEHGVVAYLDWMRGHFA
jgi:cupin fold WbuC family metalloprotein